VKWWEIGVGEYLEMRGVRGNVELRAEKVVGSEKKQAPLVSHSFRVTEDFVYKREREREREREMRV
jgi:hypothetical protein